jgi:hypothetical protein
MTFNSFGTLIYWYCQSISVYQNLHDLPAEGLMEQLSTNELLMDLIKIKCICRILLLYEHADFQKYNNSVSRIS